MRKFFVIFPELVLRKTTSVCQSSVLLCCAGSQFMNFQMSARSGGTDTQPRGWRTTNPFIALHTSLFVEVVFRGVWLVWTDLIFRRLLKAALSLQCENPQREQQRCLRGLGRRANCRTHTRRVSKAGMITVLVKCLVWRRTTPVWGCTAILLCFRARKAAVVWWHISSRVGIHQTVNGFQNFTKLASTVSEIFHVFCCLA